MNDDDSDSEYEYDSGLENENENENETIYNQVTLKNLLYIEDETNLTFVLNSELANIFGDEIVISKKNFKIESENAFSKYIIQDIIDNCKTNHESAQINCIANQINSFLTSCFMCYEDLPVIYKYTKPTICEKTTCKNRIELFKFIPNLEKSYSELRDVRFKAWLEPLKIQSVTGLKMVSNFKKESITNIKSNVVKRIMKEIKMLNKSIEISWNSSIFIRVDEDFPQFMRILIAGPDDTPYQNGLFIFDLYIPENYPNVPPKMLIIDNASIRYNPNLYKNGKVCLSLLGTWQGPGWDPTVSTLLQLFKSIESAILVKYPFNNEPAFYNAPVNENSKRYSQNIYGATIKHAIINPLNCYLNDKTNCYFPFHEVIESFYDLKQNEIKTQIETQIETAFEKSKSIPQGDGGIPTTKNDLKKSKSEFTKLIETFNKNKQNIAKRLTKFNNEYLANCLPTFD